MTSKMRYFVAGGTAVLVTVSTSLLMAMAAAYYPAKFCKALFKG